MTLCDYFAQERLSVMVLDHSEAAENVGRMPRNRSSQSSRAKRLHNSTNRRLQYLRLDTARSIRLLQVRFDKYMKRLIGKFFQTDLDNPSSDYLAISYCWGSPTPVDRLWFDEDSYIDLAASAVEVLQYLLEASDDDQLFWIDAVCIDQEDISERALQVKVMKDIYANATTVLLWLGYPGLADCLDRYIQQVLEGTQKAVTEILPLAMLGASDCGTSKLKIDGNLLPSSPEGIETVRNLLQLPYFSRTWIIQEIACGRNILMCCDAKTTDWYKFAFVAFHAEEILLGTLEEVEDNPHLLRGFQVLNLIILLRIYRERGKLIGLDVLLSLSRHSSSSDPLDKVFAFRSLVTDAHSTALPINYNLSIRDVYVAATLYTLTENRAAFVLELAGIWRHGRRDGLPSWVMDCRRPLHRGISLGMPREGNATAADLNISIEPTYPHHLKVRGRTVARNVSSLQSFSKEEPSVSEAVRLLSRLLRISCERGSRVQSRSPTREADSHSLQSLKSSSAPFPKSTWDQDYLSCINGDRDRLLGLLRSDDHLFKAEAETILVDLNRNMKRFESKLLLSSDGQFGLGPPITEEGDIICLLHVYRVPFVLRADPVIENAPRTHTLVGSCLFPSFMNSEGLETGELEDIILT